jgi:hypothetical protein
MKNTTSSDVLIMSYENDTIEGRAIAAEIEVEYALKAVAEKLRQAWQEQGLSRRQAVIRVRSLLGVFVLTLFAGSEFKRRKIKSMAHKLVNEAVVAESSMSSKNVRQVREAELHVPHLCRTWERREIGNYCRFGRKPTFPI